MKNNTIKLTLFFLCTWFSGANIHALESVKLQLKWKHQFQFAGYYMAKELGIYESAGLNVSIIEAQPGMSPIDEVLQGKADFGVGTSDLVRYRAEGKPVVVLGVVFQHSPTAIAIAKPKIPYTIHELAKQPLMIEPHAIELWAYFQNEGIDIKKINSMEHSFDVKDLIEGKTGGMSVYLTDEPFSMQQSGFDYQLLYPRSAGIDFYGDNFFTTEKLLKERPEVAKAFYKATVAGWVYAMSHINETVEVIHTRYSQRHSRAHLQFEAEQMLGLIQPDIVEPGYMNKGRWQYIIDTYMQLRMIKNRPDINVFIHSFKKSSDFSGLYRTILIIAVIVLALTLLLTRFIWLNWRLRKEIIIRSEMEDELRVSSENIESAKAEAEKANAFKSRFLASISHDLRTPLTAVIGFTEQALLNYKNNKDCDKELTSVLHSSRYMKEMIDELSDMAQVDSDSLQVKPVMLDFLLLLHELEYVMQERAEAKNIQYHMQLHWPLPRQLYADATRLRQVLFNLTANAIKFTDHGEVVLDISISDGQLLCKVSDTGIGIDETALDSLFKPFVQAGSNIKTNYGGTGLGLYISKALVEKMQGVIGVESRLGQGSCFYFKLPIGIDRPDFVSEYHRPVLTDSGIEVINPCIQGQLLIAEDVQENRDLLAVMLAAPALALTFVNDGAQALEQIKNKHFDLVLMDIQMPVMTGVEAVVELRNRGNDTPVIALSANMSDEQKVEYFASGFDGVLSKPINRKALFGLIESYLEGDAALLTEDSGHIEVAPEAYQKIQTRLLASLPAYIEGLAEKFNDNDYVFLKKEAHRLIGSCGTLGFKSLSVLLMALEDAAVDEDKERCESLLLQLKVELDQVSS